MAGHSKWANIKHRKEKQDALRGKIFTKLGREIAIAVKEGGDDPTLNNRLKDVIAKAKANNMPNDTIERNIKKAAGNIDMANYEKVVYEGYGPNGVAIIVDALTDNRNRTASDMRHYFDKYGGNLGQSGSVSFLFDKKGIIVIEKKDGMNEDEIMMAALESGAEDFSIEEEIIEIITAPNEFSEVREKLEKMGYDFIEAELTMIPKTETKLSLQEDIDNMNKMMEMIEDLDDVQNVYNNWKQ